MKETLRLLSMPGNRFYNWMIIAAGMLCGATTAYMLLFFYPFSMLPKDIAYYEDYMFWTQQLYPNNRIVNYVFAVSTIVLSSAIFYIGFIGVCSFAKKLRTRLRHNDNIIEGVKKSVLCASILNLLIFPLMILWINQKSAFPDPLPPESVMDAAEKVHTLNLNTTPDDKQYVLIIDKPGRWDSKNVESTVAEDYGKLSTNIASGYLYQIVTYHSGEDYKISVDVKDGTAHSAEFQLIWNDGSGWVRSPIKKTTTNFVNYSFIIKQTKDTSGGSAGIYIPNSLNGNNIEFRNFCVSNLSSGHAGAGNCARQYEILKNVENGHTVPEFRNGIFLADFKIKSDSLRVNIRANENKPKDKYILKITKNDISWETYVNGRSVSSSNNVVGNVFSCVRPYAYNPSGWNRLAVWCNENKIRVWVNGRAIMTMSDTAAHRKGQLSLAKGPLVALKDARIIIFGENHPTYFRYLLINLLMITLFTLAAICFPTQQPQERPASSFWPRMYKILKRLIHSFQNMISDSAYPVFWVMCFVTSLHIIASLFLIQWNYYYFIYPVYALPVLWMLIIHFKRGMNKWIERYGLLTAPFLLSAFYLLVGYMHKDVMSNLILIFSTSSLIILAFYAYKKTQPHPNGLLPKMNRRYLHFSPILWMSLIIVLTCVSKLEFSPTIGYFQSHILSAMNSISHGMFPGADCYQHLGIGFYYLIHLALKIFHQQPTVANLQTVFCFATIFSLTTWLIYMRLISKSHIIAMLGVFIYFTYVRINLDSHNHFVRSFILTPAILSLIYGYHKKERPYLLVLSGFLTGYLIIHDNLTGIVHFTALMIYFLFFGLYRFYTCDSIKDLLIFLRRTVIPALLAAAIPIAAFVIFYSTNGKLHAWLNNNSAVTLGSFPIWAQYYQNLNFFPTAIADFFNTLFKAELLVIVLYLLSLSIILNKFITHQLKPVDFSIFFLTLLGFGFFTYHLIIVDHQVEFRIAIIPYVPVLVYLIVQLFGNFTNIIERGWHDGATHLLIGLSVIFSVFFIFSPCSFILQISQDTKIRLTQNSPFYFATAGNTRPFYFKPLEAYGGKIQSISQAFNKRNLEVAQSPFSTRINSRIKVSMQSSPEDYILCFDQLNEIYQDLNSQINKTKPLFIISNYCQAFYYLFNISPPMQTIFNQATWTKRYFNELVSKLKAENPKLILVQAGYEDSVDFGPFLEEIKLRENYKKIKQYPGLGLYQRIH